MAAAGAATATATENQHNSATATAATAETADSSGDGGDMFNGLSGGGMFDGLSSTTEAERRHSRNSLQKNLSKRRPSVELQRLNILRSDPSDASSNQMMHQANSHIELQHTRQTVATSLERR